MIKIGSRVRLKSDSNKIGTIKTLSFNSVTMKNTCLVALDAEPGVSRMYKLDSIEEVVQDKNIRHFLATVAIKVDIENEGWTSSMKTDAGIQKITHESGRDGLCNRDDIGVTLVGYKYISERDFEKFKRIFFSDER